MAQHITPEAPQPLRKAFSYLRFSTPEQSNGDSRRRQTSMAAAYAAKHGLDLDDSLTFHDEGLSGLRGRNLEEGRLGYFIEAVRSGQVPQGSVLLVEQLDRLSRMKPRHAIRALERIVDLGVSVVTLSDGREYTTETLDDDPTALVMAVMIFMRANEESETKSRRLRAAWEGKRSRLEDGQPITAKLPAWLVLSQDRQSIVEMPERAALVRRMFAMALEGVGQQSIAATFNREGVQPWGRGRFWHRSYIAKVLSNPSTIGEFTPHVLEFDGYRKRRKALEPIANYFPQIVPEADYLEVQALRRTHAAPSRGRHAHVPVTNVLAGLAACSACGSTMTRVAKGKRSRPAYVCTKAKSGAGCKYQAIRCDVVEAALLQGLPSRLPVLDGATSHDATLAADMAALEDRLAGLEDRMDFYLDELFYAQDDGLRAALRDRMGQLQVQQEQAQSELEDLIQRRQLASGLTVQARVQRAIEALQPLEGPPVPADVNTGLRLLFQRAVLDWTSGSIDLEWHHGGTLSLPFPKFTKQPGPGWLQEDERKLTDG